MNINEFCAGFLLDILFGDPHWLPHPARWIGALINKCVNYFERRIRNGHIAGAFIFLVPVFSVSVCFLILNAVLKNHNILHSIFNILIIFYCLSIKSLYSESMRVYYSLKSGNINDARKWLSFIVGRETSKLNETEITRAAIETVAENTSDGIVAPMFYIFLFGPLGGLIYKTINTLDSMVGYKNDRFIKLGCVSAKFDDIANYIPARLTALLIIIISIFCLRFKKTFMTVLKYHNKHSSPNSGWPESAAAGLLGIRLGGANVYFGKVMEKPFIGESERTIKIQDIKYVNYIMLITSALSWLVSVFLSSF